MTTDSKDKKVVSKKRKALGRGLGALLSDSVDSRTPLESPTQKAKREEEEAKEDSKTMLVSAIDINSIETNPYQPRKEFKKDALEELAESIRTQGLIQPITVRRLTKDHYQLIAGERRLIASKMIGMTDIPAYIRTADDQQMLEMALIENIQRENLNAIEIALSYQRLITDCTLKQEEIGERVGKKRSTVNNYLRLLRLPPEIQAAIRDSRITMGHARAIINIENIDTQLNIFKRIIGDDLSVRKVEELVRQLAVDGGSTPAARKKPGSSPEVVRMQDRLSSHFGTRVMLRTDNGNKGEIRIPFLSTEDLNRILEIINV